MPTSSSSIPPQRLPAPTLFVAPPSRNTSNLDLSKSKSKDSHLSTSRSRSDTAVNHITPSAAIPGPTSPLSPQDNQHSNRHLRPSSPTGARRRQHTSSSENRDSQLDHQSAPRITLAPPDLDDSIGLHQGNSSNNDENEDKQRQGSRRGRRPTAILDAHWAALQSTLSDIELSASGTTSHVFGSNHAFALEDLRKAQVELARAWGPRGSANQVLSETGANPTTGPTSPTSKQSEDRLGRSDTRASKATSATATTMATGASTTTKGNDDTVNASPSKSGANHKKQLSNGQDNAKGISFSAKATEADLDAAEQRRKESDDYFRKVKESVEEVVNKLEDVSRAMRNVEMESREIWGHTGSEGSTELESSGSVRS